MFNGTSASLSHAMVGSAGKKRRRVLVEALIGPKDGPCIDVASTMDDFESTPGTASGDRRFTTRGLRTSRTGRG